MASLGPLDGKVPSIVFAEASSSSDDQPTEFGLAGAQALVAALPGLQFLRMEWGQAITGPALAALLAGLSQLLNLRLGMPCHPPGGVVAAALAAQEQAQAGLRQTALQVVLYGAGKTIEEEEAAQAFEKLVQEKGLGSPKVTIC